MALVATAIRTYSADFVQTWAYMQNVYAKQTTDTTNTLITRRAFFQNGVLSVIAQVENQPATRTPMLASLSDYIDLVGSADGLEFIYLTLINAANDAQDKDAFDLAVQVWQEGAAVATVDGAGPMGFYDINSQKMAIYNDTAQAIARSGSALVYGTDIAKSLLSLGYVILDDPYGLRNNATKAKARRDLERKRQHRRPEDRPKYIKRQSNSVSQGDVWKAGAAAVGTALLEYAAIAAVFPAPDPVSKGTAVIAAIGGGVLEFLAAEDFGEKLGKFTQQSQPLDSTTQITIPDGGLCIDPAGQIGVSTPSVDTSDVFDTPAGDGGDSSPGGDGGDGGDGS
jgi:hypothetical protein